MPIQMACALFHLCGFHDHFMALSLANGERKI